MFIIILIEGELSLKSTNPPSKEICCICDNAKCKTTFWFKYDQKWYKFCDSAECMRIYQICRMYMVDPLTAVDLLVRKQQKICECCGESADSENPDFDYVIEHCHRTHRIRGITCKSCNIIIGKLESDRFKNENINAQQYHYDWIELTKDLEIEPAVQQCLDYARSKSRPISDLIGNDTEEFRESKDEDDFWIEFGRRGPQREEPKPKSDLNSTDVLAHFKRSAK